MRDAALYFPTIEFRSEHWLKASLLVWDRLYRIVPAGYRPHDSPAVKDAVDAGLIRDITLEPPDLIETGTSFEKLVRELEFLPDGLDYAGRLESVHREKIDSRLYPVLEALSANVRGDWIDLPQELARGYLLYLAKEVAHRRALALATDNPDAWVVTGYLAERGAFSEHVYDSEASRQYCHIGFDKLLPLDASHLPMSAIIRISQESADDRAAFRQTVRRAVDRPARRRGTAVSSASGDRKSVV